MTERRRHIQSLVCDGRLFALCEEGRLWQLDNFRMTWIEMPPLPCIEIALEPPSPFDGEPPTLQSLQDLAHYLAQNPSLPHSDTPPFLASDQQDAPPTIYDQFEDPLA